MIQAADGVDAAYDRNNPLWSAEQKHRIYSSNVFGYETGKLVDFESQEKARQELYASLGRMLPKYFSKFDSKCRTEILDEIKKHFEQGISDTTRPQNETTLWEHSYAVASILKVVAVHNLLNESEDEKIYDFRKVRFGILGIGWDGMRFLSQGQKIGDIMGRKRVIEYVKLCLKKLIEFDYPLGNEIYADDDGTYFIVPARFRECLNEIWAKVEDFIYRTAAEACSGELQPHIAEVSCTTTLTSLVKAIQDMRENIVHPFDGSAQGFQKHFELYLTAFPEGKTVCPVCRLRHTQDYDAREKICKTCRRRRRRSHERDAPGGAHGETVFIDEIADGNRRAALIVARFDLDAWLDGRMVRSLFVTEAKDLYSEISNPENVKQFEGDQGKIKDFLRNKEFNYGNFSYDRIKADIDAILNDPGGDRATHVVYLYDRPVEGSSLFRKVEETKERWKLLLEAAKYEHEHIDIYNLICAKTPTPSTLLDVWATTQEFFEAVPANTISAVLPTRARMRLKTDAKGLRFEQYKGTLEAEAVFSDGSVHKIEIRLVSAEDIEVIGEIFTNMRDWSHAKVTITDDDYSGKNTELKVAEGLAGTTYMTYRTITTTPNLFMTIVPADRAVEITGLIYHKYIEQFGKVMGRLPFSIGNIFFDDVMPMFVVLDSAKRMVANFDALASKKVETFTLKTCGGDVASCRKFDMECDLGGFKRTFSWFLPHKLGNCEVDFTIPISLSILMTLFPFRTGRRLSKPLRAMSSISQRPREETRSGSIPTTLILNSSSPTRGDMIYILMSTGVGPALRITAQDPSSSMNWGRR